MRPRRLHSHLKRLPRSSDFASWPTTKNRPSMVASVSGWPRLRPTPCAWRARWNFAAGLSLAVRACPNWRPIGRGRSPIGRGIFLAPQPCCPAADRAFGTTRKRPAGSPLAGSILTRGIFPGRHTRDLSGQNHGRDQTQTLIDALAKAGWCRELGADGHKGKGRPARRWAVNPRLKDFSQ